MIDWKIFSTLIALLTINNYAVDGRALTYAEQQIQTCINQDLNRQPIIIDTDSDVDDLWAIHYLLNVSIIYI